MNEMGKWKKQAVRLGCFSTAGVSLPGELQTCYTVGRAQGRGTEVGDGGENVAWSLVPPAPVTSCVCYHIIQTS